MSKPPHIHQPKNKKILIKYGGNSMTDDQLKQQFAADIVSLQSAGVSPIVVHGGGPQIGQLLKRIGKQSKFINGERVTDDETMEVAEMVLSGTVNKSIVKMIQKMGVKAVGISGPDAQLLTAERYTKNKSTDLGRVGSVKKVNPDIVQLLIDNGYVPIIAPIGVDEQSESININADLAASAIAQALKVDKFILLTNTIGVLDANGNLLTDLNSKQVQQLIDDGTLAGGMLPKIRCALAALTNGVPSVKIADGRVEHAILTAISNETAVGTNISL